MDRRTMAWAVGLIALGLMSRLLPHPPNFVPLGAIALAAGAVIRPRWAAYVIPLAAMLLADLAIGLHRQVPLVYACLAALVWLGTQVGGRAGVSRVSLAAVGGATLFFVVTNLGVWAFDGLYPHTPEGLVACYVAALPFYWNSLAADVVYAWVLFGVLAWFPTARVGETPAPGLAAALPGARASWSGSSRHLPPPLGGPG